MDWVSSPAPRQLTTNSVDHVVYSHVLTLCTAAIRHYEEETQSIWYRRGKKKRCIISAGYRHNKQLCPRFHSGRIIEGGDDSSSPLLPKKISRCVHKSGQHVRLSTNTVLILKKSTPDCAAAGGARGTVRSCCSCPHIIITYTLFRFASTAWCCGWGLAFWIHDRDSSGHIFNSN